MNQRIKALLIMLLAFTTHWVQAQDVAKIGSTGYATLADAVAAADVGATIEVVAAGNYTLPNLPKNVTIKGNADGVVSFTHTTAGNVASVPNGATFKNVKFIWGNENYHGFQHAGTINMEGCTLDGKLFSYGDMNFTNCSFTQSNADYHMWAYSGNVTYTGCTFSAKGKFIHLYNESGATKYTVTATNCTFINNASSNKAALNVKATSGSTLLAYDVIINNCSTEGSFPGASSTDALVVLNSLVQVDDRPASGVDNITVTQDGVLTYPVAVAVIGETRFETLDAAVAAANTGDIIEVIAAGDYTLPNLPKNVTIEGKADGVVSFTHTTAGNVASVPNGATFKNVKFIWGNVNYHGFQHAGTINMEDCTLDGRLTSYGDMNFTNCSFTQSASDYHMWTYAGNVTYTGCTFTNSVTGKFINVYNESGATKYTVTATNCTFINNASSNKAALNVKATSGSTLLAYDVIINNCSTEGSFPGASSTDALVVLNSLVQVDDRPASGVDNITVTQDGVLIYPVVVAQIGSTGYATLQAAVDAAHEMTGNVTIELLDNISGYSIVHQKEGLNLTIDGKSKTLEGQIIVIGDGRLNGAETLTIQNIQFNDNTSNFYTGTDAFVLVPSTKTSGTPFYNPSYNNHAHNITISGCTFTGDYPTSNVVAFKSNSGTDGTKNLTMEDVTATNLHSLAQLTAVTDATFDNCSATQTGSFIGANGGGGSYIVKDCTFESHPDKADGYAFREKSSSTAVATLTNNNFNAHDAIILGSAGTVNVESGTYTGAVSKTAGTIAISGGYFSEEFPQEYIAADLAAQGQICIPATDKEGYFTVGYHYVAQIGETKFASLAAAVTAAQANDVITMIDDDNVSLTAAGSEITIDKPLTITGAVDENGKPKFTIFGSTNGALNNNSFNDLFLSCSTGTVTISNLKFDGFGNEISSVMGHSPVFIGSRNQNAVIENVYISNLNCEGIHINGGSFTIKDCNIDCSKTSTSIFTKGICVVNDAQGSIENTTITGVDCDDPNDTSAAIELQGSGDIAISGCTIQTNTIGIATTPVADLTAGTSQVTISDCTIESQNIAVYSNGDKGALTSISSGRYSGLLMAGDNDEGLSISGGLFDDMPEQAYCAEGYAPADNTDAATMEAYPYTVLELPDVAQIGDVKYKSLQAALDAAHEMTGDVTIELLDNISGYSIVHQKAGVNITIDGADKTVAGQIIVDGDGRGSGTETLTIQNVKFEGNTGDFLSGTDAFVLIPSTKDANKPYTTGKYNYAHNVTVKDCSFTSTSSSLNVVGVKAPSGAGLYNVVLSNDTGTNLHSLAQLTGTTGGTIENNTVTQSESFLNVNGGAGEFTVSGNTFTSAEGADGYGVRENAGSSATINLTGNTFTATNPIVLGKGASATNGTINVADGIYTGTIKKDIAESATGKIVVSGGYFSEVVPEEYIVEGKICVTATDKPGYYTIKTGQFVAQIGEVKYETLEEAFGAAEDGATITLLANCDGNGIKVPQGKYTTGLTVDFNNFTYEVTGNLVGSSGTETLGFQLLKDNTITFKNGTITSSKALFLVQNYSNLTLEGMTLTLANDDYTAGYTVSNNNGNIVIDGSTINVNTGGGFAFDVCRYSSYPSVSVTVTGDSEINGNVEVSASGSDAKDGFTLMLESGKINGELVIDPTAAAAMASTPEKALVKENDSFGQPAPADFKWESIGEGVSKLVAKVYVAQIGDVKYESLAEAVAAVPTDGTETTITMIADANPVGINGATIATTKNVKLDLNGKTITLNIDQAKTSQLIDNYGTLTIVDSSEEQTGKLTNSAAEGLSVGNWPEVNFATNIIKNSGTLNVEGGTIQNTADGSICYAIDNNSTSYDAIINFKGGTATAVGTVIRQFCNSTTKENILNISGGSIVTNGSAALWTQLPGSSSSSKKKATLNITGGEIKGNTYAWYDYSFGDSFEAVNYSISGGELTGYLYSYAISNGVIDGFVSGGLFSKEVNAYYIVDGYMCAPYEEDPSWYSIQPAEIYYYWYNANNEEEGDYYKFDAPFVNEYLCDGEFINLLKDVTLTSDVECKLNEGAFTMTFGDYTVTKGDYSVSLITGVSVNTDKQTDIFSAASDDARVVEEVTDNGYKYTAVAIDYVAKIGDVKYESLADAIAAVGDGETITMLRDVDNAAGLSVPEGKNFTVDFAGCTYTLNKPGAGSTGTETIGFQLLKNSTIIFKNGTINISEDNLTEAVAPAKNIKRIIQNYANLTLEDMTIDGTNQYGGNTYVVSFNNGTSNIIGSTSITAGETGVSPIMDVYLNSSYTGTNVTINTTGVIGGDIETCCNVSQEKADACSLTITNADVLGTIVNNGTYDIPVSVSGGIYDEEVLEEFCAEGYVCVPTDNGRFTVKTKEDAGIFDLVDWENYPYTEEKQATQLTYSRRFINRVGKCQPWIVPFDYEITEEDAENFDFYKINLIASSKQEGEISDDQQIYVNIQKVGAGYVLKANRPYELKPKGEFGVDNPYVFKAQNVTLKVPDTETSRLHTETSRLAFDFYANYTIDKFGKICDEPTKCFCLSASGTLMWLKANSSFNSYRWYAYVTDKYGEGGDDYSNWTFVMSEDDPTGIYTFTGVDPNEIEGIYTPSGVKIDTPVKGINIIKFTNGTTKKVYIK